jgi:hypothetical protein
VAGGLGSCEVTAAIPLTIGEEHSGSEASRRRVHTVAGCVVAGTEPLERRTYEKRLRITAVPCSFERFRAHSTPPVLWIWSTFSVLAPRCRPFRDKDTSYFPGLGKDALTTGIDSSICAVVSCELSVALAE